MHNRKRYGWMHGNKVLANCSQCNSTTAVSCSPYTARLFAVKGGHEKTGYCEPVPMQYRQPQPPLAATLLRSATKNSGRIRTPTTLPAYAATSHSQPCTLPEAMPLKYAPMLQPYASREP